MSELPEDVNPEEEEEILEEEIVVKKSRGHIADVFVRLIKEKPLGLIGGVLVLVLFLTGIFADFLAPYGFNEMFMAARLTPPSGDFLLGTDNMGRDLLSRIIYGARISMIVGLCGSALHVIVGFLIGGISGFYGGKFDIILQRFIDSIQCFPALILYLTIMAVIGQGLLPVILVLGISSGFFGSRTIRSAVIGIKENVYIDAAQAIGASDSRILFGHIMPNIMPVLIIEFTLAMGRMIISEAMLSFLGFGIPPPTPSWGGMLSGAGRRYMFQAPWLPLWPGLALALGVYGINMLGDALRDLWDPRLRGGLGRYSGVDKKRAKRLRAVGKEDAAESYASG
jgi:peptide/nickel transport system permease protein